MFHTQHKVWIYLHGKRNGPDDTRWDLDHDEVKHMKGVLSKIVELHAKINPGYASLTAEGGVAKDPSGGKEDCATTAGLTP